MIVRRPKMAEAGLPNVRYPAEHREAYKVAPMAKSLKALNFDYHKSSQFHIKQISVSPLIR
jgi:hypothetical protein